MRRRSFLRLVVASPLVAQPVFLATVSDTSRLQRLREISLRIANALTHYCGNGREVFYRIYAHRFRPVKS